MPGTRRALPPRRLDRQPAGPERRHAEVGQVLQRRHETGRGDDVVDFDREVGAAVGPAEVGGQPPVADRIDPVDRRVEDADAAAQDEVLERLDVARPDADQGLGLDRQARLRRRHQDQLPGPRQEPGREFEPGVLLAQDQDAAIGVRLGRPHVGVVVGVLHPDTGRRERLGDADRDDEDAAAVACRRSSRPRTGRRRASRPGASRSSGSRTGRRPRRARRTTTRFASISGRDGK